MSILRLQKRAARITNQFLYEQNQYIKKWRSKTQYVDADLCIIFPFPRSEKAAHSHSVTFDVLWIKVERILIVYN